MWRDAPEPGRLVLPTQGEGRCPAATAHGRDRLHTCALLLLADLRAAAPGRLAGQPQACLPPLPAGWPQPAAQAPTPTKGHGTSASDIGAQSAEPMPEPGFRWRSLVLRSL